MSAGVTVTLLLFCVILNVYPLTVAYVLANFCGGMTCVILPALSCVNGTLLNPFALKAQDPKFELELVIDWSPPLVATK